MGESHERERLEVFGATLRRRRLEAGLSLRALARQLGLSGHSGLVDYESGRRLLPADLLSACEEVFGDTAGELRRLWQAVHVRRAQSVTPEHSAPPARAVPFPADLADFAGRDWELAELESLLDHRSGQAPSLIVISGPPGAGKTSIAVHLAHRLAGRYPDALLYVDLRGTARPPLDPVAALGRLLHGSGVRAAAIPAERDDRSALLRAELYSRRALLLLDDAADEDQVRPLLPAGARNTVVITSRSPLAGLESAHHLSLTGLRSPAAVELFAAIVGAARVLAEPAAAAEIVRHCGLLPLAIRIAAARLAQWPAASLDLRYQWESMRELGEHGLTLARELGDTQQEIFALNCLGLALRELGRFAEAAGCSERALTLAMANGDEMEQATSHYRLGATLIALDRAAEAVPHLETAIHLNGKHHQHWDEASSINRLALALRALGRYPEAVAGHEQAIAIFESIGAVRSTGLARTRLGFALSDTGRHTDAAGHHLALAHFRDGHDEWGQALARYGLGITATALGKPTEAAEHLRLSALLFKNQNDPLRQARAIELVATLHDAGSDRDAQTPNRGGAREGERDGFDRPDGTDGEFRG
ncbi:tetratricopeptide repeat protein [Amycolatopsis vastitatis]|uniref:tetratricopeptide repeat protein n=1 Tax=Amycolatopsis vastitatis TaxID=1905142 RepID=UPI0011788D79|nr:tetratricopeptide repeat protein [Amycolatopsis vastitatis]